MNVGSVCYFINDLDQARAPQPHRDASQDSRPVVRISVKDEGQGASETDVKKLFERFQRLSAKPTRDETATGLGLFIVKRIVELRGGSARGRNPKARERGRRSS